MRAGSPHTSAGRSNRKMYAVAIRDSDGLWLFARISCSIGGAKAGVSVLPPRDDPRFSTGTPPVASNPHSTYHRNGEFHFRSYSGLPGNKPFLAAQRQKLDASFSGSESVWPLPIQPGEAVQHQTRCVAAEFQDVCEILVGQLPQEEHHTIAVDLVERGATRPAHGPWRQVITQKSFPDLVPQISILVTLWRGMTV